MKVVEVHRRQNEGGDWVTTGRTWRTVKAGYEIDIDFTKFAKGDLVRISGRELTESSEGNDGRKFYTLTVKAESVEKVEPGSGSSPDSSPASNDWGSSPASSAAAPTDEPF
jgi:single-stranded DNA-binding protein